MRGLGIKTLVFVALFALLVSAGCGAFDGLIRDQRPQVAMAYTATPVLIATPTPTLTPSPTATPTPTPAPTVSVEEAKTLVRDYFEAMDAGDYQRMRELTVGQARETTDGIAGEVQQAEQANNVTLSASTKSLEFAGSEAREDGVALDADFAIEIAADMGFFSVPVRTMEGKASFLVESVAGQAHITNIDGDFRLDEAS